MLGRGAGARDLADHTIFSDGEILSGQVGHGLAAAIDDAHVDVACAFVAGSRRALSVLRLRESGQGQGDCDDHMLHQGEPLVAV